MQNMLVSNQLQQVCYINRTLEPQKETEETVDPLTLLFIVGMAVLISFIAQKFSGKGRRK